MATRCSCRSTTTWRIDQPAATLWYHTHPHGRTADHIYRGLAGLFLIDDPDDAPEGLPDTYGADDIPIILQDKRFNDDGSLDIGAPTTARSPWSAPTAVSYPCPRR